MIWLPSSDSVPISPDLVEFLGSSAFIIIVLTPFPSTNAVPDFGSPFSSSNCGEFLGSENMMFMSYLKSL